MDELSAWLADAHLAPRPALAGDLEADVVVAGAGIAGLTTALLAQRDGADVIVLEGHRLGGGSTGRSTGKVTSQHGLFAASLVARHGEAAARAYAQANQAAVEKVAELVQTLGIDCAFRRSDAYEWTADPARRLELHDEAEAAARLGLPAELVDTTPLPFPVGAAVRFREQVQLDPALYVGGLADAFEAAGGRIFEHSRVMSVHDGGPVVMKAVGGTVRAAHGVVTTLLPIVDIGAFFAKSAPSRSYGIAVTLADPPPEGMHISVDAATRSTRAWQGAEHGMVVVGEGHPTGHGDGLEAHYDALEHWTREHFDVIGVHHRWSAQDYRTIDQLPYVGRCPRTRHILTATGFAKWGLSNGSAAAMMLADVLAGRDNPWLATFDATRFGDLDSVGEAARISTEVAKRLVGDRIARLRAGDLDRLAPGEGGIVHVGDHTVAAFRDLDGKVSVVSPTCTHLGCTVQWNDAERSWDCPCHGSRFSVDGAVLDGPAVKPLKVYEVD